jgi:outer membrane protein TolC
VKSSYFTPPLFGVGSVLSNAPAGTQNPATTFVSTPQLFPFFLNQWFTQASITIPLTDYLFTIPKSHAAASELEEATVYDTDAARAKALTDGKIAYYSWLRARGALNVAQQTLAVAKAHLHDSELLFNAGSAPKADVSRSETAVAASEVVVGLGLIVAVHRRKLDLDVDKLSTLRG